MQLTYKTLVLSAAAFCATAAFAANRVKVDVPFSFTAKGQSYPAGSYDIVMDNNANFVTLASDADTQKRLTWSVGPGDEKASPGVLTFDQREADYSLKTIQIGDKVTGNLDKQTRRGISATTSIGGQ